MGLYPPKETTKMSLEADIKKSQMSHKTRLLLGIIAGIHIAMAAVGASIVSFDLPYIGLQKLISGLVFPVGLLMIVFTGAELFTGNTMFLNGVIRKRIKTSKYFTILAIVFFANLAGCILVAWGLSFTDIWGTGEGKYGAYVIAFAVNKVNLGFMEALLLGTFCNFLVCTAIWISRAARDAAGKILAIFFPIMLFVVSGFEHIVANFYLIPAGIMAKANLDAVAAYSYGVSHDTLNWSTFFINNVIPVTIGNIIGGAIFVSLAFLIAFKPQHGEKPENA